ncbi:Small-conductance mechanosensitive channel [Palleronia salina]|uniref:Small-conductance mechanosensitive channel n=1 Tax=Palleronia salina TaxID=313368 RepID=A0A1M6EU65_9RHOB|nr:mechanosensitive ion channel family protein [Palleronia salina]SHI88926.1 Small-conductance mechanosensitive channel [Palleronia salina]
MTYSELFSTEAVQLALLALAVIFALSVHRLVWRIVLRFMSGHDGLIWRTARRLQRPFRLVLVILAVGIALPLLELPGLWEQRLEHAARALLIVFVGWSALIFTDVLTGRAISRTSLEEEDYGARTTATQLNVLQKVSKIMIILLTAGVVLSTFEGVRSFGLSLFASAGAAGLVLGFAARPVLANLIAGIQIALTQPIRLNDVVIVEGEWGWIEEIRATYVVIRIWDLRRMVVPLAHFIEKPFQNWTRESSQIIGGTNWHLDYTAPVPEMRKKLREICEQSEYFDGKVCVLQVIDTAQDTIEIRALMSARNSPRAWELRCEVREKMIDWLQRAHPHALPRRRAEVTGPVETRMARPAPAANEARAKSA